MPSCGNDEAKNARDNDYIFIPEVSRQRVDAVLDKCGVPSDREAYYRFIHRIAHKEIRSKEELDVLLREFEAKGCDKMALMKLADLNSLYNPRQFRRAMGARERSLWFLRENWLSLLAIPTVIAAMLVMFHDSFIMDVWIPGPTQRFLIICVIVVIAAVAIRLGLSEDRKRRGR